MRLKDEYGVTGCGMVLIIALTFVVMLGTILGLLYASERYACSVNGNELGMDTHYRVFGDGCYVELADGRSIPLDKYRATDSIGE